MKRWITSTFVACLLTGCVTVTEQAANSNYDKQKAAEARIVLGLSYLEAGDMMKAKENLERAVKHAPDYYRALNSIAYYYQQVGEHQQAEEAYKKALRKSPKNGDVLNNYGAFLCKRGDYEKADKYFNRAIEQPYYYLVSASYENAGMCAVKGGNKEKAHYYFARSLDHEPNRYLSLLQLAKLEVEKGELDSARSRLVNFHQRSGYKAQSLALLIELEQQAGQSSQAKHYSDLLGKYYPDSTKH